MGKYTLKVDWSGYRVKAVCKVLGWHQDGVSTLVRLALYGRLYAWASMADHDSATITLDVPPSALDALERILSKSLARIATDITAARENAPGAPEYMECVHLQGWVFACLQDVQTYRYNVAMIKNQA